MVADAVPHATDRTARAAVRLVAPDGLDRIAAMLAAYLQELGAPARYPYLPLYAADAARYAYEFHHGAQVVGFALVRRLEGTFEMAEFHVSPPWRRVGIGRAAVAALLATHPGAWEVASAVGMPAAERFWREVLPDAERRRQGGRAVFHLHVAPGAVG